MHSYIKIISQDSVKAIINSNLISAVTDIHGSANVYVAGGVISLADFAPCEIRYITPDQQEHAFSFDLTEQSFDALNFMFLNLI